MDVHTAQEHTPRTDDMSAAGRPAPRRRPAALPLLLPLLLLTACQGGRAPEVDARTETSPPPRAATAPVGEWLAGDLHVHSDHSSDGSFTRQGFGSYGNVSVADQIAQATRMGLDWLPITDHRTFDQHYSPQWTSDSLLLIEGEEANGGPHCTVHGAVDTLVQGADFPDTPRLRVLQQSVWAARGQNAVWIVAHPDAGHPADAGDPYAGLPCDGADPEMAEQMLADAGVETPISLNTIVMTGGYATAVNEAQSLQAQLSAIGVELELEQLETNVYVDRWLAGDFDAAVALNGGRPDPHLMYVRYFTSDGNLNDVAQYSSDELDQLFAEGKAETDPDARADIYEQVATQLLEASPWAWVFNGFEYRVLQPEVEGFTPTPTGSLKSLREVTISQ